MWFLKNVSNILNLYYYKFNQFTFSITDFLWIPLYVFLCKTLHVSNVLVWLFLLTLIARLFFDVSLIFPMNCKLKHTDSSVPPPSDILKEQVLHLYIEHLYMHTFHNSPQLVMMLCFGTVDAVYHLKLETSLQVSIINALNAYEDVVTSLLVFFTPWR